MHKLQMYENLRDMLEREVQKIEKMDEINEASLNNIYKLTQALKAIDKCIDREEAYEMSKNGMSRETVMSDNVMHSNAYPRYSNRGYNRIYIDGDGVREAMKYHSNDYDSNSYNDGSYAGHWGKDADNDGRYNESSRDYRQAQNNSYAMSYNNGYSRDEARKKMVQKLETLMDDTMSEKERQAIKDCISRIE